LPAGRNEFSRNPFSYHECSAGRGFALNKIESFWAMDESSFPGIFNDFHAPGSLRATGLNLLIYYLLSPIGSQQLFAGYSAVARKWGCVKSFAHYIILINV